MIPFSEDASGGYRISAVRIMPTRPKVRSCFTAIGANGLTNRVKPLNEGIICVAGRSGLTRAQTHDVDPEQDPDRDGAASFG